MVKTRHLLLAAALIFSFQTVTAQDQKLTPINADDQAADQFTTRFANASHALTPAGRETPDSTLRIVSTDRKNGSGGRDHHSPFFFPADLSKFDPNGAVVPQATLHNIFINQPPSAWGNPVGFLNDLNHSNFIHIVDQYVGVDFDGRYPVGQSFSATVTPASGFPNKPQNIITFNQIVGLVHGAGSITGTGYDHIFNVFIPPGADTCFPTNPPNQVCFSPDNPNSFVFCAFHTSGTFSDIGHVLITVIPETGVPGCGTFQPSANGLVADSVDSSLSHEVFETITDPDGDAFIVLGGGALQFEEIGDVCVSAFSDAGAAFDPTFKVGGHLYSIQLEYSNRRHGCASRPQD